jgi:hypothetical protein
VYAINRQRRIHDTMCRKLLWDATDRIQPDYTFPILNHPVLVVLHIFVAQDRRPGPLFSLSYFCMRHWIQLHGMTSFLGDWSTITFCRPDITATISANAQHYCHAYLPMATTTQDITVLVSNTILVLCYLPFRRKHRVSTLSLSLHFRNRH